MDKTAQKMRLSKLREKLSPKGKLEEYFQPRFKEVMENLRQGDDSIRSIVAGEKLGDGDPGKHAISLKELLKRSKTNFNRREYMAAISDFSRFHDKLREVVKVLNNLNLNVDKVHHQFLFQDMDEENKSHLMDLENRWKAASQARQLQLRKEAGIMDLWHNLTNERGIALRKWEKQYPKKTEELKRALIALQQEGEKTVSNILSSLKELAGLRASRNPEEYMKVATSKSGLMGAYNSFDKLFQKSYSSTIQRFISDMKSFQASQAVPAAEKKEMADQSVPVEDEKEKMKIKTDIGPDIKTDVSVPPPAKAPSHLSMPPAPGALAPAPDNRPTDPVGPPSGMESPYSPMKDIETFKNRPDVVPPAAAPSTTDVLNKLQTTPPPAPAKTPAQIREEIEKQHGFAPVAAHGKFYAMLESMSGENPLLLANLISKYAKKIQASDPATSIQLLSIVKRIKG